MIDRVDHGPFELLGLLPLGFRRWVGGRWAAQHAEDLGYLARQVLELPTLVVLDPVQPAAVQTKGLLQLIESLVVLIESLVVLLEDTYNESLALLNPRHQLVEFVEIMADLADLVRDIRLHRHGRE